jgi:hypothetical protein
MKIENPLVFYPRYGAEILVKLFRYGTMILRFRRIYKRVMNDPARSTYADLAIMPQGESELATFALYHETSGGEEALARKRRADDLRAKAASAIAAE